MPKGSLKIKLDDDYSLVICSHGGRTTGGGGGGGGGSTETFYTAWGGSPLRSNPYPFILKELRHWNFADFWSKLFENY